VPTKDPRFLVTAAEEALLMVVGAILDYDRGCDPAMLKRREFHVVVVGPQVITELSEGVLFRSPYKRSIGPHIMAERSEGDRADWKYAYQDIARGKALQLWEDRNDGGTDIQPHLLFEGDTPFWGGVKRSGIVVTCSGVQPYFDRMIAGMVADATIGLAYDAWMRSPDKANDELCFLT
jgi:hypothetical protein